MCPVVEIYSRERQLHPSPLTGVHFPSGKQELPCLLLLFTETENIFKQIFMVRFVILAVCTSVLVYSVLVNVKLFHSHWSHSIFDQVIVGPPNFGILQDYEVGFDE